MELVSRLESRKVKPGRYETYGLFLCPYCNKKVERIIGNGRKHKSCGCMKSELISKFNIKHGDGRRRSKFWSLYEVWRNMRKRCYYEKNNRYKNYGGRGIGVCEEWKNNYITFKEWALNNGYRKDLTIDRIDNNGNYSPENCRFVSNVENYRNSSRVKLTSKSVQEIRKKYLTKLFIMKDLAEEYCVSVSTINNILKYNIWKDI